MNELESIQTAVRTLARSMFDLQSRFDAYVKTNKATPDAMICQAEADARGAWARVAELERELANARRIAGLVERYGLAGDRGEPAPTMTRAERLALRNSGQ